MDSSVDDAGKKYPVTDRISQFFTDGGIAVARVTGKVVGYSGKMLRVVKETTTSIPVPGTGLFTGGVRKIWGGERSTIKVNIAKTKQKMEKIYLEIGKRGAKLSGVEDITKHESVQELITEIRSCENQIQSWEERIKELEKEKAQAKSKIQYRTAGVEGEGPQANVKNRIKDIIDNSSKTATFDSSSDKAIFDKVTHDLLDDDIEIRLLAAAELGKMASPASIPVLKEALGYGNVYLSSEIINALININDPSCMQVFKAKVNDQNYRIRLGSLRGIYKLAGPDSVTYLVDGLKDKHQEVRKSSATFLGWVGVKDAVPALIQTLKDPEQEVKKAGAMSLSILRDPSSIMPLIRALRESSIEVREKIIHAIERVTGKAVEFKIDASGDELKNSIESLKDWWQKNKMADVDEVLEETSEIVEKDGEEEKAAEAEETSDIVEEEEKAAEAEGAEEAEEEETLTEEKLQKMLKKDLIQKCEDSGIEYSSEETKTVLIEKILDKCGN